MLRNKQELLHTPDGVRDTYGEEYAGYLRLISGIHEKFREYGYEDIKTPSFEFFDVFSSEIGTTPSRDLYKFFDKEGNTLVLRPDFTPSVARCAAKYFGEERRTLRFCYQGSAFSNTSSLQGKLKESTHMGAECIGDGSVYADAEAVALLAECLKGAGLSEFQISIGNAEYFKGLCEAAGLPSDTEMRLREFISGKNYFAAQELLREKNVSEHFQELFLKISDFMSSEEELLQMLEAAENDRSRAAIRRLIELLRLLKIYGVDRHVSFDLSLLSKYHYYTGVIFKAFTYGVGEAVASGGRYDSLLSYFGKEAPAIGFMIPIEILMSALFSQHVTIGKEQKPILLEYDESSYEEMLHKAMKLRADGAAAALVMKRTKQTEDHSDTFGG